VSLPRRLRIDPVARRRLARVAGGLEPADLALHGGLVLNVFTGRLSPMSIGIAEGRIAWVGEPPAPARAEIDLGGRTVVPGLIDPHCHVDMLCTPTAFVRAAAERGTTTAVVDTYTLTTFLDDAALAPVMDALERMPMKAFWGLRPSTGAGRAGDDPALPAERLRRLRARETVMGCGELTAWRALLDGEPRIAGFVDEVIDAGLRVDGHLPGASPATLARLAAAGITSDHEAITGEELAARIEVGMWTMVRHSSLRRDGVELGREIVARGLPTGRLMLTADGLLPQDLVDGHLDAVVRRVVEGGVDPVEAVRMATINPATYLGFDAHIGSITPGRCADLLVVDELESFRPQRAMCDGRFVDPDAPYEDPVDWGSMTLPMREAPLTAQALVEACEGAPPIRLQGVIARLDEDADAAARRTYVAVVARDGSAIAGTTTRDYGVPAIATSVTSPVDLLLIGTDPEAMVDAYRRVVRMGGGLASPAGEVALPTFGHLRPGPIPELARALRDFEAGAGLAPDGVPFAYQTLFLTMAALPGICLTPEGMLDVRSGRRLTEAVPQ
jgi:adenine deaminase